MQRNFWLEEVVKKVSGELKYVRSVDGFLVKLSTLLYDIVDECAGDVSCSRSNFERALRHTVLRNELSRLSCHRDVAIKIVSEDPRFKSLRSYLDIFESALEEIECSEGGLEVYREATFRLEKEPVQPEPYEMEVVGKPKWVKPIVVASVALAVVLILLAVLLLVR